MSTTWGVPELLELMARLRDPDTGCPWDRRQDFRSVAPHTLEEACEVIDAIERADYAQLAEELGDLLFQVVFHAQLGREQGRFDFDAIVSGLVAKLLARHPHVFPDGTLDSRRAPDATPEPTEIRRNWARIKQAERAARGDDGALAGIPLALSALTRAAKLQQRAAEYGFDWSDPEPIPDKIREELDEVRQARASGDAAHIREEIGDLLFACVNLARHLGVDGEAALRAANRKFAMRFDHMIAALEGDVESFRSLSATAKEALWQRVKTRAAGDAN
ncbi:MAG: nucleoside triphosphate pyrophosphohydrolase [Pseudomonadales bacterium]|nr:nucleoside triphosphate pyrophosphohydrolase [Pseudomonadales bacterium]